MRRRALVSGMIAVALAQHVHGARATGEHAMRKCVVQDAPTIEALRRGDKRVAVVVKSFHPPAPASAALVVRLAGARGAPPIEITRFAVHPPRAFGDAAEPQRFLVSLASRASLLKDGEPICIEVGFATAIGAAAGGDADIDLEVVDVPGKR